jgi:hypothetical protein
MKTRMRISIPSTLLITMLCASSSQGALSSGEPAMGAISAVGAVDSWTITASQGDRLVVQIAELSGGAGFTPRIEMLAPDGATLGASSGDVAARLDIQAPVSGTFTLAVSDVNRSGTGTYQLQLAQMPGVFTVPAGDEGGSLTNGINHQGAITLGDLDLWTFTANAGDRIALEIAEISGGAGFTPMIELFTPDGARLGINSGSVAARLDAQAAVSGNYTVLVSDATQSGTGSYRLRLAQVPGVFSVPAGDEGGSLTNGANHTGTIDVGDLDLWTFSASKGDRIVLQLSETSGGSGFTPMLELFAPDGARLGVASDASVARLDVQADVSGTYTVLISDAGASGTGGYELRLAQVPESFIVPAGDEGGALPDGIDTNGTIGQGDLDLWTFTASTGDRITLQITELTGGASFTPMIEVFSPNGERKRATQNATAATLDIAVETVGTYTVLVSDANRTGAGTYRLNLARGSIAPAGTNVLVSGATSLGAIASAGESNTWTFTASAGESIVVHLGETTTSGFVPWLRLYGPNGALLGSDFKAAAAEVSTRATNSGTFSVVIADGSAAHNQTGEYRLSMAKTGSPLSISPSDEGGALTNGASYTGTIDTGDMDAWSFTANAGESIMVWVGEITASSSLVPWLRLYGPDGTLLGNDFNAAAAEVTVRATNSGTFLVVIADGSAARSGVGDYRLSLAKTGTPLTISPSDEGGTLTNGASYAGTIDVGDVDAWTFTANAGESITVWAGEITSGSTLVPWVRLFGPDGTLLGNDFNGAAAEVTARATNRGTFLVVIADGNAGRFGIGNYRLSLAKTGSPLMISPSDEGGALTNGTTYTATIETGDVDAWSFIANAGESIVVRAGETATAGLLPWVRLFGPNGALLSEDFNASAAEVTARATNSGTFLVVVGDGNAARNGTGNYRLSLVKTGIPLVISPTDEGGALTNGTTYMATIDTGDVDAWTFTANAGENIIVRMGETATLGLLPWLRLYSPNGVLLDTDFNAAAAEVTARATNSGTFLVVAADGNSGFNGSGNYRLSLAKTGSPLTISPSDEGGTLVNGTTYLGTIDTGDLDAWTFTANAGESIVVRMGETTVATLLPWLRLYGPNGVLLSADFNAAAAEVTTRATNSGVFQVVAADGNSGLFGSGNYRLSLAKTGEPLTISAGDEGGEMAVQGVYEGAIDVGDVDAWTFTGCAGDLISLHVEELVSGSPLTPWIRLYGRDGVLLNSDFGAASAQITRAAPANGTYLVIISDATSGFGGAGSYRLTAQGLYAGIKICLPVRSGTNLIFQGAGGQPNSSFIVLTATNVATPLASWTPLLTNQFLTFGEFNFTNAIDFSRPEQYFSIQAP